MRVPNQRNCVPMMGTWLITHCMSGRAWHSDMSQLLAPSYTTASGPLPNTLPLMPSSVLRKDPASGAASCVHQPHDQGRKRCRGVAVMQRYRHGRPRQETERTSQV